MTKRKDIIRVNDVVKIINPLFVERVGYPLSRQMVKDQMSPEEIAIIKQMFASLKIPTEHHVYDPKPNFEGERAYTRVLDAIASFQLSVKRWGGRERSIHTKHLPDYSERTALVVGKRCVKTGSYKSASGGYSYDGEYDYEPAFLHGEKTHVILEVNLYHPTLVTTRAGLEIESANVVKMVQDVDTAEWKEVSHVYAN